MIELTIALPLLLVLSFVVFYICDQLSTTQNVSALSRELTNAAYRDCVADSLSAFSQNFNPQECLDREIQSFVSRSGPLFPGVHFVVTLYNYDAATNTISLTATSSSGGQPSRIPIGKFTATDELGTNLKLSIQSLRRLMIGEVYIPARGRIIYAATII